MQKAGIGSFRATRHWEEEGPPHLKVQISSSSLQSVVKNSDGQVRTDGAAVPVSPSPHLHSCPHVMDCTALLRLQAPARRT